MNTLCKLGQQFRKHVEELEPNNEKLRIKNKKFRSLDEQKEIEKLGKIYPKHSFHDLQNQLRNLNSAGILYADVI